MVFRYPWISFLLFILYIHQNTTPQVSPPSQPIHLSQTNSHKSTPHSQNPLFLNIKPPQINLNHQPHPQNQKPQTQNHGNINTLTMTHSITISSLCPILLCSRRCCGGGFAG